MFFNKKENSTVAIINAMTDSMERLHVVGGLGYAVAGLSVIVGILALVLQKLVPGLINFLMFTIAAGIVVATVERFVAVRLATEKLRLISAMAQQLVSATIPKDQHIDSLVAASLMNDILVKLWRLDPTTKGNPHSKTPAIK